MKLTKPGKRRSFAAYLQCSADRARMSAANGVALPSCREIEMWIPVASSDRSRAIVELARGLDDIPTSAFAEITVRHEAGPLLTVLVNGAQAWLMCARFDGDAGFSSRNPDFAGEPGQMVKCVLSNGQVDHYPAGWFYPTARVFEAVRYFAERRQVPGWLQWFNEAGDGAASPNEHQGSPS